MRSTGNLSRARRTISATIWTLFVTMMLLEDSRAVLSLVLFCEEMATLTIGKRVIKV